MPTVIERRTKSLFNKLSFIYNKPVSSSDLNEMQDIMTENIVRFNIGTLDDSTLKMTITNAEGSANGISINQLKYICKDENGLYFIGGIDDQILLRWNSSRPSQVTTFYVYGYWRSVVLDSESSIYKNGIRANAYQAGLTEQTVDNNIFDNLLDEEVSVRQGLELTFFLSTDSTGISISDWSSPVKICEIEFDPNTNSVKVTNEFEDLSSLPSNVVCYEVDPNDNTIVIMTDKDGNSIYPKTKISAVMDENGNPVLNSLVQKSSLSQSSNIKFGTDANGIYIEYDTNT